MDGKKWYGLTIPKKAVNVNTKKKSVFDSDDSDHNVEEQVKIKEEPNSPKEKRKLKPSKAAEIDSSIYEYDSIYDEMKASQKQKTASTKTKEMDLDAEKLIALIEVRPAVYDYTLKEHHNRDQIERLWDEIAKEMDAAAFDCKSKWNNLRSSYSRHLREMKIIPSGNRAHKKRKKWYLAGRMSFLQSFLGQHRKMGSNIPVDNMEPNEDTDVEDEGSMETTETEMCSPLTPPRTKALTPVDMVSGPMMEFLKFRTMQSDRKELSNPLMDFFKSLVPDVEKLTPRKQRKFKEKVMVVLNDFLDEEESEATFQRSESSSSACSLVPALHQQSLPTTTTHEENFVPSQKGKSEETIIGWPQY